MGKICMGIAADTCVYTSHEWGIRIVKKGSA